MPLRDSLARFLRAFPAAPTRQPPAEEAYRLYHGRLPAALTELWRAVGWGPHGDGVLNLVDPRDLEAPLSEWLEVPGSAVGFARTSFGCLYCWQDDEITFIDVHEGSAFSVLDDLDVFFGEYLHSPEAALDDLRLPLHRAALARLGAPGPSEMYAFVPALVMGGDEDPASVVLATFREHVAMLAGLHGG